jgi:hypothetical protein
MKKLYLSGGGTKLMLPIFDPPVSSTILDPNTKDGTKVISPIFLQKK